MIYVFRFLFFLYFSFNSYFFPAFLFPLIYPGFFGLSSLSFLFLHIVFFHGLCYFNSFFFLHFSFNVYGFSFTTNHLLPYHNETSPTPTPSIHLTSFTHITSQPYHTLHKAINTLHHTALYPHHTSFGAITSPRIL